MSGYAANAEAHDPMDTCPECQGTGKVKASGNVKVTCPMCNGKGKVPHSEAMAQ